MRRLCLLCFALLPLLAPAATLDTLKRFIAQSASLQAEFEQRVTGSQIKKPQLASGTLSIQRPGKFRWDYRTPFEQQIVGDGSQVWLYDPEIRQVTVRKLDKALGSSPAALLAGDNALEKNFAIAPQAPRGGLEWLEAKPRDKEATFRSVRLGFRNGSLEQVELDDNFDQTTTITLKNLQKNPKLAPGLFQFAPPPNVDVVRD